MLKIMRAISAVVLVLLLYFSAFGAAPSENPELSGRMNRESAGERMVKDWGTLPAVIRSQAQDHLYDAETIL